MEVEDVCVCDRTRAQAHAVCAKNKMVEEEGEIQRTAQERAENDQRERVRARTSNHTSLAGFFYYR